MRSSRIVRLIGLLLLAIPVAAVAQQAPAPQRVATSSGHVAATPGITPAKAKDAERNKLVLYFAPGSATLNQSNIAILDHASRLYREGHPVMMIVSGSTDTVGSAEFNLILSQERADSVVRGLIARGIPADRTQLIAKGQTDLAVPTAQNIASAQNRRVTITWH